MGAYCKMLVAYDDSESSRNALKQAVTKFDDGWIKVLAVVPVYDGDLELVGVRDKESLLRGPREDYLRTAREIVGDDETERIRIDVVQGQAFEEIVDAAQQESCTMIVMGRRGLHNVERMLMGSVTAKVIVHTDKDVLVIPRESEIGWDRIIVAMDGSAAGEAALKKALAFALDAGSGIRVVSVVDMYPEYYADAGEVVEKMEKKSMTVLEGARREADAAGVSIETQVLHGDPAEEITNFAKEHDAGVIFVGNRGRSGLKKIFLGSVAQKVIGLAGSPVYVAKNPR